MAPARPREASEEVWQQKGKFLSDLLIPSAFFFAITPLVGAQSGHMGNKQSRRVSQKETKDATCMLMCCEAQQKQRDEVCRFFGKGCKTEAQATN